MSPIVVFDMDGTLLRLDVDIEEVRLRLAALFAPYGVTAPFRPILARIDAASAEAAATGGEPARLRAEGLAILDRFELEAAQVARARPGAVEVVTELGRLGVRLGVVTDNGRACARPALEHAGFPAAAFTVVTTRDDVPRPKPDPAGVLAACAALGDGPAWYVGDHVKDVEAGQRAARLRAGLRVAAVAGGFSSADELRRAGAEQVVDEPRAILALPGLSS